ncbi:hypothetical protein H2200_002568 [Cladophialophora chaetospira]|uniref:Uncharacterized protein n=1 Tax=Cladophialophora chaetospira TaxID=386627 RepID=A0AA38XJ46_9EURO|nr:hypothetical protein H2200_002568 [Cladophialophora chaetospira]
MYWEANLSNLDVATLLLISKNIEDAPTPSAKPISFLLPTIKTITMNSTPIAVTQSPLIISRPTSRGRRCYTMQKDELRIRREKLEREAKRATRDLRQISYAANQQLEIETKKAGSVVNLIQSLLQDLAKCENDLQDLHPDEEATTLQSKLERKRAEINEALKTLEEHCVESRTCSEAGSDSDY